MVKPQSASLISLLKGLREYMTYTEISKLAGERLQELTNLSLIDAVISCVSGSKKNNTLGDIINDISLMVESCQEISYFAEATVSKKSDPEKVANNRLKNGFVTGGIKFDINKPPIWDDYKSKTRNLRYKLHSWVMLDTLLTADEVSETDDYLLKAVDIAHDWIRKFVISKQPDEFAWYDMAVGQRATKLPYMISRMIEMNLSPKAISHFIIAAEIHCVELSQSERIAFHSNHGLFQIAGSMALVKSLPWLTKSKSSFQIAVNHLEIMLDEHFTKDGLHKEHSPEYHLFMINHLSALLDSGWLDEMPGVRLLTEKVEAAAHWMQDPKKEIIAMGDSKNNLQISDRWHSASEKLPAGLNFFEEGGFVVHNTNRAGGIQLAYSCQFHSRQHKHADHHNFTYFSNGRQIFVDAGTYIYQYDLPERIYCESTRAHNTVEIDGYNYSRFRKDVFGSAIDYATEIGPCVIISGEVRHKRLISSFIPNNKINTEDAVDVEILHRRTLIHYPSRFLAIIDELESPNNHEYIQWNHLASDLQVREYTPQKFGIHDVGENVVSRILITGDSNTEIKPILIKGQTQPHLQGWISKAGAELVENPALGFASYGKNASMVTVIDTKVGRTGDPYFRTGSNGAYKRFALTQDGLKVDLKFRRHGQDTHIEAVIDGEKFDFKFETEKGD
jgi:hypothetical protein